MKKIFILGGLLLIVVLGSYLRLTSKYRDGTFVAAINTKPTSVTKITATPVPTITVDYAASLVVAQSTADEARRVNVMVTAQFQQRALDQLQMTAASDRRIQEIYSWTVTAASTSIPLTATQQAIRNAQILQQQNLDAANLTATQQAPTLMVAMSNAQNTITFSKANNIVNLIGRLVLIIFCISLVVFIFRKQPVVIQQQQIETPQIETPQIETVIQIKTDQGGGYFSTTRNVVPCSPEQLLELCINITQGKKTLAVNQWEGRDTLFTRPVFRRVRAWLREARENPFVVVASDGQYIPTEALLNFMCGWVDTQQLKDGFEFEAPHSPNTPPPPNHATLPMIQIIPVVNHEYGG